MARSILTRRPSDGTPGALIAGGHFLSLGAVRNLNRHGVPVWVIDSELSVCRFSNRVARFVRCPPSADEAETLAFLETLAIAEGLQGWVLFPSTDEYVRIFSQQRERLGRHFNVTTPAWEAIRHLYDKRLTAQLAARTGVPAPATWVPADGRNLDDLPIRFPVVVKPAVSTRLSAVTKKKAYRADDQVELRRIWTTVAGIIDPAEILVQELIPGKAEQLYSYVGLFRDGLPVAGLAARRLRQHPMDFGRASTYVETADVPELAPLATRLLQDIAYTGLAEVEFMYDRVDGRFELLEVNPRIWGWHSIAVRAGLHLPHLAYLAALERWDEITVEVARTPSPPPGVKWIRMVTDLPTALQEMAAGRLSLRKYLSSFSGAVEFAVFSPSDPLPFIADVLLIPYYARRRGF